MPVEIMTEPEHEEGHYFDFSKAPIIECSDPKLVGRLTTGRHNHVSLDGVDVTRRGYLITQFMTGANGWIDYYEMNDEGTGLDPKKRAHGVVVFWTEEE